MMVPLSCSCISFFSPLSLSLSCPPQDLEAMLGDTPPVCKGSSNLFRNLRERGRCGAAALLSPLLFPLTSGHSSSPAAAAAAACVRYLRGGGGWSHRHHMGAREDSRCDGGRTRRNGTRARRICCCRRRGCYYVSYVMCLSCGA